MDHIAGYLEVGTNDKHEVVINHPDLKPDENGVGHIVFSPGQARRLARYLLKQADIAEHGDPSEPAWVMMETGLYWWGDWTIQHLDDYGWLLTVGSGVQYGPYEKFEAAKQKAYEVRG